MYASAWQRGLGRAAACDPMGNTGLLPGDPGYDVTLVYDDATGCWVNTADVALTPTVVQTPGTQPAVDYGPIVPVAITPTTVPQELPPLTTTVPRAAAGFPFGWLLFALFGSYVVIEDYVKSQRRGR